MPPLYSIFLLLLGILHIEGSTRVIELSDRFIELRGDSPWVVMFYAPWCGHCKKLEPVWSHVAQALYGSDVRVGRVDCTRFTGMGAEFAVKGYPTIMYIQGDFRHVYSGDRTREELVGYAVRMASQPIPHISLPNHFKEKIQNTEVFFLYTGPKEGELWETYSGHAKNLQPYHFFYSAEPSCIKEHTDVQGPAVMVFKDDTHHVFSGSAEYENITALNNSLSAWINHERFPLFIKITHGNLHQLWKLNKYLVITVVKESKVGSISADSDMDNYVDVIQFREMVHSIIKENRDKYHPYFQFGWTGAPDLANGIAMEKLSIPAILVVNSTTMHHHMPEDPAHQLTPAAIQLFLDSIITETAVKYGGDTIIIRMYRMYYNSRTALEEMWLGNPVLTSVLFGLPLGFLSLICYSIWCSDIMDAEEEDDEQHEKKE